MTVYCPTQPTLLSVNGGDYVEYPAGTDIRVTPVTLQYSLMYAWTRWNGSFYDCSTYTQYLRYWRGSLGTRAWTLPNLESISQLVAREGGAKWVFDNCVPINGSGFSYQLGTLFYNDGCGRQESQVKIFYNGSLLESAGQVETSTSIYSVQAYKLEIITP